MNTITDSDARRRWLEGTPVTDRRLTVQGVSTALLEGGDGPPIVLLHGQGGFGGMFAPVLADLTATHRVVAPDLPGLGASTLPEGTVSPDLVLDWLDELIAATCDARPTLVGHSLGGSIAARFAARHPGRLERVVLADAGGLAGRVRPSPRVLIAMVRLAVRPSPRNADRFSRRIMHDHDGTWARLGPERREAFRAYLLELARMPTVQRANRTLLRQIGLPAIPPRDLARIEVPTSLVWGRHDPVMPIAGAEDASRRYGWPLYVIDDAGHVPAFEQPARFLDALRRALASDRE